MKVVEIVRDTVLAHARNNDHAVVTEITISPEGGDSFTPTSSTAQ